MLALVISKGLNEVFKKMFSQIIVVRLPLNFKRFWELLVSVNWVSVWRVFEDNSLVCSPCSAGALHPHTVLVWTLIGIIGVGIKVGWASQLCHLPRLVQLGWCSEHVTPNQQRVWNSFQVEREGIMAWPSAGAPTGWGGEEVGAELWRQQGMLSLGQDLPEGRKRDSGVILGAWLVCSSLSLIMVQAQGMLSALCPVLHFWEEIQNLPSLHLSCCLEINEPELKARCKQVTYFRPHNF